MYEYKTPNGYGDTFFQYVFDAEGQGLVDGQDYFQKGVQVNDGEFLVRYWSGLSSLADGLQIYDWLGRRFASDFMRLGTDDGGQMVVLPEVKYPDGGNIRFDLQNVHQSLVNGNAASQLVFSGVRRRKGVISDPVPSSYKYYEKEYSIPYTLTVPGRNTALMSQIVLPIEDFDFELRRVEISANNSANVFKILLYDTNWKQVANLPVLSSLFFHSTLTEPNYNFWPCPPLLYRVNSVIRFNVYPLLDDDFTYQILFKGVRRIPCN